MKKILIPALMIASIVVPMHAEVIESVLVKVNGDSIRDLFLQIAEVWPCVEMPPDPCGSSHEATSHPDCSSRRT